MRRPSGIIFDLGDTIIHLESYTPLESTRKLLEFSITETDITAEEIQSAADELNKSIGIIKDETNIEFPTRNFNRLLYETFGLSFSIDYSEMERQFWNTCVKYVPIEGIYEVLDALDKYQIKTGILSNSSISGSVLLEELEKHNLAHRFSFLISTADYGIRKPDKRIFDVAIKKLGLATEDIWFVGDKVDYDVKGATDAGLFPVLYNWRNESIEIDSEHLIVKDWYEFCDKLEQLYIN